MCIGIVLNEVDIIASLQDSCSHDDSDCSYLAELLPSFTSLFLCARMERHASTAHKPSFSLTCSLFMHRVLRGCCMPVVVPSLLAL